MILRETIYSWRTRFLLLHSFMPLTLGVLIYLFWRSESTLVFSWLRVIHLSDALTSFRHLLSGSRIHLPDWFLYSLPDGLWLYAATTSVGWLWLDHWRPEARLWVVVPLALGCATELGQLAGAIPGTFSAVDVAAYLIGSGLGLVRILAESKKGNAHAPSNRS